MANKYLDASRPDNTGNGTTPELARKHPAGSFVTSGDVIYVRRGYYYDPVPGSSYHFAIAGKNDFTITTYGDGPAPIFDSMVYEPPSNGGTWTNEGNGVWSKLFGSASGSNGGTKRLFRGAYKNGNAIGQRSAGTPMRRAKTHLGATSINYNSLAVVKQYLSASDPWVWAGSALGYKLFVFTGSDDPTTGSPPVFYNGLGLVHVDDSVGLGGFYAVQMIECRNALIMGIDSHASTTVGFAVAGNVTSKPSRNISIIGCNTKYAYQGAVRVSPSIATSTTTDFAVIENVTIEDCIGDAGTHVDEQEYDTDHRNMSGAMDMFTALNGVKNVIFRRCTAINSTHVAFTMGQFGLFHEATLTDGCGFEFCTMFADTWATYSRGFTTYNCKSNCFIRNTLFDGQSVWSQLAGAARIYCNTWINMKLSQQKPETAGCISVAAELLDRTGTASGWPALNRFVPTRVTGAVVAHNVFDKPNGPIVTFQTFGAYNVSGVPEPTIADGAFSFFNNIVTDTASGTESFRIIDRATAVGLQNIENNAIYRGSQGPARVWRQNISGVTTALVPVNNFAGAKGNLLVDPQIDLSDPRRPRLSRNSPCRRAGRFAGNFRDRGGRPFKIPPTIGAMEYSAQDSSDPVRG